MIIEAKMWGKDNGRSKKLKEKEKRKRSNCRNGK
jgi:hypothetical protein